MDGEPPRGGGYASPRAAARLAASTQPPGVSGGSASSALAPASHPNTRAKTARAASAGGEPATAASTSAPYQNTRAATQLAAPTQPRAVAFAAQEECDGGGADEVDDGSGDAQGDVGVDVFSESTPRVFCTNHNPL